MDQPTTTSPKLEIVPISRESDGNPVELADLLNQVRGICEELGAGFSEPLARVAELQERLAEERFQLAVLGQFKRGKSTLLNALLGEPLLSTGIVPLTSIPTFLRAGKSRVVRVFFRDGKQAVFFNLPQEEATEVLSRYVTESQNPKNQLGVDRVEVEHPSPLLSTGVVLIDTPGIGSTLRHNTEVTYRFLPQCDAALFVVSADLPITEVERDFLKAVDGKVAKLCLVMNKVDYLTKNELAEASEFFRRTLRESGIQGNGTLFNVSAKQGIEARIKEDPLRWRESGLEQLQNYLLDFLSREKSRALQIAVTRKAAELVADVALDVGLQQRSAELSRQELERRIQVFDVKVKDIDQEKIIVGDLLGGDQKRTRQLLEDLAEKLRDDARQHLRRIISEVLQNQNNSGVVLERQARDRIGGEIPAYFADKLTVLSAEMNGVFERVLRPYYERLDTLVGALRSTAAELFDIAYRPIPGKDRLEETHKPYWVTQKWNTSVSPLPEGFFDRFLPAELRKQRLQKCLNEEVETLITQNVENLRWATLRNLDDAFRRFSLSFGERLMETAEATRGAMRATDLRKTQDEKSTQAEIKHFKQQAVGLAALEETLLQYAASLQRQRT